MRPSSRRGNTRGALRALLWSDDHAQLVLGRRGALAAQCSAGPTPGMQAEDHLGRLPPSWLTPAGTLPAGFTAGGQSVSSQGWLSRPGAPVPAHVRAGGGVLWAPSQGRSDPGGSRTWWPRRHDVRGFLLFGAERPGGSWAGTVPA